MHPETAMSLNNLARLIWEQGDFAGARPLYERAIAISVAARGPEHPHTNLFCGAIWPCPCSKMNSEQLGGDREEHVAIERTTNCMPHMRPSLKRNGA